MLPSDKHDTEAVELLARTMPKNLHEHLPALLKWLQDPNWPVARPITDLLVHVGAPVLPHVSDVLRGNDSIWKYWVIVLLVDRLPVDIVAGIASDLRNLVACPSESDLDEEVNVVAAEALNRMAANNSFKPTPLHGAA